MLPGMFHCRGGGVPDTVDWLTAIVDWVENGTPPGRLVASQYKNNDYMTGKHSGLLRTRPLHPYPNVSRYTGEGDISDAANWQMTEPPVIHNDDIKWVWDPK